MFELIQVCLLEMARFPAASLTPSLPIISSHLHHFNTCLSAHYNNTNPTVLTALRGYGTVSYPQIIHSHHIGAMASSTLENTALIVVDVQEDFCPPVRLLVPTEYGKIG